MKALTKIQREVYDFIVARKADSQGMPPTRAEICEWFGWASSHAAQCHLLALSKKGWITLLPGKVARGIVVENRMAEGSGKAGMNWQATEPPANTAEG